jgi:catechol 2,3-dioxygenase-like lactoylglutathione lyase family enzyme
MDDRLGVVVHRRWKRLLRSLVADPGRFAGATAVRDPLGLLAVERERRQETPPQETLQPRKRESVMDYKLEVVVVPVSDVGKAKDFYTGLGWRLDADFTASEDFRVIQVTPPGSACSVIFGTGLTSAAPGSAQGLHLTVTDIDAARAELAGLGVDVSEVFHDAGGVFHHAGTEGRVAGAAPNHKSYGSFVSFSDPDGNGWYLQEITTRLPGR